MIWDFQKKVTFDILKYLEREFGRFDISKKPFQIPKRIFKTLEQVTTSRMNYSGSREGDSMSWKISNKFRHLEKQTIADLEIEIQHLENSWTSFNISNKEFRVQIRWFHGLKNLERVSTSRRANDSRSRKWDSTSRTEESTSDISNFFSSYNNEVSKSQIRGPKARRASPTFIFSPWFVCLFVWPPKRQIFALCPRNCAKFELLRKFPTSLRCSHAPVDQFSCVHGFIWLRKSSGIAILFFLEKLCRTATALAIFFCFPVHALDKRKKKQTIPLYFASSRNHKNPFASFCSKDTELFVCLFVAEKIGFFSASFT